MREIFFWHVLKNDEIKETRFFVFLKENSINKISSTQHISKMHINSIIQYF